MKDYTISILRLQNRNNNNYSKLATFFTSGGGFRRVANRFPTRLRIGCRIDYLLIDQPNMAHPSLQYQILNRVMLSCQDHIFHALVFPWPITESEDRELLCTQKYQMYNVSYTFSSEVHDSNNSLDFGVHSAVISNIPLQIYWIILQSEHSNYWCA